MTTGAALEGIIGVDAGGRGLARHADNLLTRSRGNLEAAAVMLASAGPVRPLIVTGFPILSADPPGTGETDGPPGALALARAAIAAGGRAVLAAEGTSARALSVAVDHLRLKGSVEVVDLAGLPHGDLPAAMARRAGAFTHLIAVERVGPTHTEATFRQWAGDAAAALLPEYLEAAPEPVRDRCLSMRGLDVSAHVRPAHLLFEGAAIPTIGIGDGGNEIGMGAIGWDVIHRNIPHGGRIACRVPARHVIVAGVSNWGAWALAGLWRKLSGASPLPGAAEELALLELMGREGPLVDGVTGRRLATVDGLAWYHHARVHGQIMEALR